MKAVRTLVLILATLTLVPVLGQEDQRQILRGTVLYRNTAVPNENVINATAEEATITNERGEFAIPVKVNDELIFMAVNYQIEVVRITEAILQNNRLVVEVNEKVTQLDEVVVSPEEQEEFLRLQNEDFQGYEYDTDETSEITNIAVDPTVRGMRDGLNFVSLFKLVSRAFKKKDKEERPTIKISDVLRQVYDDSFFVRDLGIPQENIADFLYYCDDKLPEQDLLRKENEFQLIDFLVNQSKDFRKALDDQN